MGSRSSPSPHGDGDEHMPTHPQIDVHKHKEIEGTHSGTQKSQIYMMDVWLRVQLLTPEHTNSRYRLSWQV